MVCGGSNEVYVIDVPGRKVVEQIPVGLTPDGIDISPDGNTLYVANSASNDISVIDLIEMSEKQRVAVGAKPFSLAVSSTGSLFVVETGSETLSLFGSDLQKLATARVGKKPIDVCLSKDERFAYVTVEKDNQLAVYELR